MFDNKKEDSDLSLPDLPSTNSPEFIPAIENPRSFHHAQDLPELPSLPSFPKHKESDVEKISAPIDRTQNFKTIEMKEWIPEPSEEQKKIPKAPTQIGNIPDFAPLTQHTSPSFKSSEVQQNSREPITQDIFIKIDKFRSIRKSLRDTQDKLEEIDSLLAKIRETKIREEQELSAWERELTMAKSRINDINTNIFEKVR